MTRPTGLEGIRRAGVIDSVQWISKCSGGRIEALDRPRLEARVCECYAVVKREYRRLLQLERIVDDAGVHGACRRSLAFA